MKKRLNLFKSLDKIVTEIPISEVMVTDVKTLKEDDTVQKAVDMMAEFSIGGILIRNKNDFPTGIVSEGDILKKVIHQKKDPKKMTVKEIMTHHLFTITKGQNIGETANLMKRHHISKLPVVEDNKLIGYVTKSDLLEKLNEIYYQNTRLKWLPIMIMIMLIIIAVLIVMYLRQVMPLA